MTNTNSSRSVVLTGAAGDMGRTICDALLAEGFTVYAADLRMPEKREGVIPVALDVTDRNAVESLAARVGKESHPWAWINAAGVFSAVPVIGATSADWDRIIAVNLTGTFHGCLAALDMLRDAGGGRIVNVGSISGQLGGIAAHPAYGASKAGVHALTKTYALEGAKFGILCNAVAPGLIEGTMSNQFNDRQQGKMAKACPLQRLGRMDEIARAILFLALPSNTYMTGVIMPVNGGAYMPS